MHSKRRVSFGCFMIFMVSVKRESADPGYYPQPAYPMRRLSVTVYSGLTVERRSIPPEMLL